ncbi:MAG TPA: ion channel [Acidobacteriota bacterium]|nr:ion channel [Acidobacteriota bacterium]
MRERTGKSLPRLHLVFWTLILFITMLGLVDVLRPLLGHFLMGILLALALSAVLVAAVASVTAGRRTLSVRIIQSLVAAALLVKLVHFFYPDSFWRLSFSALAVFCIAYTIVKMLRFLLRTEEADLETVAGAVSVYLLLAIGWGIVYSIQSHFDPEGFGGMEDPGEVALSFTGLYYSLVTVTTLGYGDITPVSTVARLTSAMGALSGQIVLVVLIARIVSLTTSKPNQD